MKENKLHYFLMTGYDNCHDGDEWIGIYSCAEDAQVAYWETFHRLQEKGYDEKVYLHVFDEVTGKWEYDQKMED